MLNIWDIQRISNQWLIMVTDTSEVSAWYLYIHWLAYTIISSLVRNKEVPHWPYWSCCNTSTGSSCYNPEIFSCFQITFITSWLEILNSMWIFHCKLQIHKNTSVLLSGSIEWWTLCYQLQTIAQSNDLFLIFHSSKNLRFWFLRSSSPSPSTLEMSSS